MASREKSTAQKVSVARVTVVCNRLRFFFFFLRTVLTGKALLNNIIFVNFSDFGAAFWQFMVFFFFFSGKFYDKFFFLFLSETQKEKYQQTRSAL